MKQNRPKSRPSRKPATRRGKVLARLALTRHRQKAWRERPEHMEGIRQRAIAKAKAVKDQKNQNLIAVLSTLPDRLTPTELRQLFLDEYCRNKEVTEESFFLRVKRRGLMAYDPDNGTWVNLTKETKA